MRDLRTWEELQSLVGVGTEGADLDFKEVLNPKGDDFSVEIGKDIAALANTLGGHIVVGVSTDPSRTRCTGFHGLSGDLGAELAVHFERTTKDRCRPTPFMSTHLVDIPNHPKAHVVLVVRVEASAIAPVGASVRQPKGGALVDEAWVFPYRVGSQTEYLTPDQFGAFESMTARRVAALLDAIPFDQRADVELCWGQVDPPQRRRMALVNVDVHQNAACFLVDGGPTTHVRIPLEEISTVWMEYPGKWRVVLRGVLRQGRGFRGPNLDTDWAYIPRDLVVS